MNGLARAAKYAVGNKLLPPPKFPQQFRTPKDSTKPLTAILIIHN